MALEFLNDTGWDGLNQETAKLSEEQVAAVQEAQQQAYEMASLVNSVLGNQNAAGALLLSYLRKRTIEHPTIEVGGSVAHDRLDMQITPDQWLWIRAGQNSVIHWLERQIEMALAGPPDLPETKGDVIQ